MRISAWSSDVCSSDLNAAMLVVIDFNRSVDTQQNLDVLRLAVGAMYDQRQLLLRTYLAFQPEQIVGFCAVDAERGPAVVADDFHGQHANADQHGAMDALIIA